MLIGRWYQNLYTRSYQIDRTRMDQQLEPPTTRENANDTDDASVQIIPLDYDDANERTKYQWHNLYGHARQRAFITRGAMAVAMVLLLLIILANNMLSIGTIPR